ncbi:hypothetical protein TNCV_4403681 [Trichonephila clavipes]|uniref:Uncharacterized protein n=1 Tax=Trichonephila clavipes TaxID=2585209 RepID=A0A8X6S4Q3_TRICX|nr:hypothetical protein TNCV_4403681 [Trichonephila clavipes]
MNPLCFTRTVQGSDGSIMIWSMVCWHGSGALVFLEGKHTAMRYLDILTYQVHSAMLPLYPDGDGYFMGDNATMQLIRSVQIWFAEHQCVF